MGSTPRDIELDRLPVTIETDGDSLSGLASDFMGHPDALAAGLAGRINQSRIDHHVEVLNQVRSNFHGKRAGRGFRSIGFHQIGIRLKISGQPGHWSTMISTWTIARVQAPFDVAARAEAAVKKLAIRSANSPLSVGLAIPLRARSSNSSGTIPQARFSIRASMTSALNSGCG